MRSHDLARTVLGLLLVGLSVADTGGSAARVESVNRQGRADAASVRQGHHEEELAQDPSLRAVPDKVRILQLAPGGRGHGRTEHVLQYRFEETETFTFCIPADDPHLRDMNLIAAGTARRLVHVTRNGPCQTRTIPAGEYDLRVRHAGADVDARGTTAFVHVPREQRLLSAGGGGGSLPSDNCDSSIYFDVVIPQNPRSIVKVKAPDGAAPDERFVVAEFSRKRDDGIHDLFLLKAAATVVSPGDLASRTWWSICGDGGTGVYSLMTGDVAQSDPQFYARAGIDPQTGTGDTITAATILPEDTRSSQFKLSDLGNADFTMMLNGRPIGVTATGALALATTATTFTLVLTYYPPGTEIPVPPLQKGEAALVLSDQSTWVLHTSLPDLEAIHHEGRPLTALLSDAGCCTMKLGPETIAAFYQDKNYQGATALVVGEDTTTLGVAARSLKFAPVRQFVASTKACNTCNLSKVDLSELDLSAGSFQHSIFQGATLTNTVFRGAALDYADFSGAETTLTATDFGNLPDRKTALKCTKFHSADLTAASFGPPENFAISDQLKTDFSCRLDLSAGVFDVRVLPPQAWPYLNLAGAHIRNVDGASLSTATHPVDLRGAILTGVDLTGVHLDHANLGCATVPTGEVCTQLADATLTRASLQGAAFVNANLQGARLDYTNLTGANLAQAHLNQSPETKRAASLVSAQLKNVNLAHADLSGATLSSANFYSGGVPGVCAPDGWNGDCATAAGATMNSTAFTGAYLNGTDLSGVTAQGVDFSGALLLGVNLTRANLTVDSNNGVPAKFVGAFLQGANFADANVAAASFLNAYVTPDAPLMVFQLAPAHTAFSGYQPGAGATPGCVLFSSDAATALPTTDSSTTCPNGAGGPCTVTAWHLPLTPISMAVPPSAEAPPPGQSFPPPMPESCRSYPQIDENW